MSACCKLRSHSPFKTVFNKLGDIYQAYCNTYKTHAVATCHGGTGHPLDKEATPNGKDADVDILHNHHEDTDDFETIEQENHTNVANLTWELDNLHHGVQAREGQLTEALHCIECKLQDYQ